MAAPFLQTLSSVDVGETDPQWSCTKLSVPDVLELGPDFVYYLTRVLEWIG